MNRSANSLPTQASALVDDSPALVDHVAVARLYGEPLFAMPLDCTSRRTH